MVNQSSATEKNKSVENLSYTELGDRPGFLIRRLHQIHVAMFLDECGDNDVTPVQFGVLDILCHQSPLDQGTLGAQLGIDRTNIADVVARLEKRDLVKRVTNPNDRRVKLVSVTTKGRRFAQKIGQAMMRTQERLVDSLNVRERNNLMSLLKKMVAANNESGRAALHTNVAAKPKTGR